MLFFLLFSSLAFADSQKLTFKTDLTVTTCAWQLQNKKCENTVVKNIASIALDDCTTNEHAVSCKGKWSAKKIIDNHEFATELEIVKISVSDQNAAPSYWLTIKLTNRDLFTDPSSVTIGLNANGELSNLVMLKTAPVSMVFPGGSDTYMYTPSLVVGPDKP